MWPAAVGSESAPGFCVRLTQFADEVHGAVVAAERRIQVDEELDVEASHLSLQDVGDGLPLVLLVLPLPPGDVGTPEEQTHSVHICHSNCTDSCVLTSHTIFI